MYFYHIYRRIIIYIYKLECKKGCDIDYIIETDIKDLYKKTKPTCLKCGRRVYPNEDESLIVEKKKKVTKQDKTIEQVMAGQKKARRKKRIEKNK